jgi:8-oxo-dGTP pyrophosphatase MutT (NUDIX family)
MYTQIVTTVIIIYSKGKFLLVQRALDDDIFPGKWQNAGGKMERGETLEQTAKRELAEETGIIIDRDLQFVMSYAWQKGTDEPWRLGVIMLIDIDTPHDKVAIQLDSELAKYGWFTSEEIANLDTIGPDSPTGTFGQISRAEEMIKRSSSNNK